MIFWVKYEGPFGASKHKVNIWVCGYDTTPNYMIANNNIVSFCIFSLLKYDRIFGKNLEHDNYEVKHFIILCGGSLPGLVSKFCIVFVFYDTFQ